jgi:hypothetical protein
MTCKQEMTQEFRVGDIVKIVDTTLNFYSYEQWAKEQGLIKFLVWGCLSLDSVGMVVAKAPHSVGGQFSEQYGTIYGIEIEGKQYIVGGGCLELIEECSEKRYEKLEESVNTLTIESFLRNLPDGCCYGVCYKDGCFIVKMRDEDFVAATEERLQEIMKALLVLYKG